MKETKTLAEINNNPLNIRYSPANQWQGQTGQNKGFCTFRSEAYGWRAAYIILTNYIKNGHDTIRSIINRWAPPSENNTEKYIEHVCETTLLDANEHLTDNSIRDYWLKIEILQAMAKMECGKEYDHQQINLMINNPHKFE